MPLPVTSSTLLYWCVGFKFTDAEETLCHSRWSASNAHILCASPTIPSTGRHQTSKMAQCGENVKASSPVNGDQKAKRKVALITGITGQVTVPTVSTTAVGALLCRESSKRFPFWRICSSVLHLTGYNIVVAADMRHVSTGNNEQPFIVNATAKKKKKKKHAFAC